jgi:hypothetical protein
MIVSTLAPFVALITVSAEVTSMPESKPSGCVPSLWYTLLQIEERNGR